MAHIRPAITLAQRRRQLSRDGLDAAHFDALWTTSPRGFEALRLARADAGVVGRVSTPGSSARSA